MPKVQVHAASKKNMKSRQKSSKKTGKKTGGVVNLNESAMYSASVIKPFVMASTFDQIKKGNLKYNSTVKDKYTKTGCHHTLHPASSASVGDGQSNITKRLWYSSGTYLQRNLCIIKILKRDAEAPACSDKKMEDTVRHSIRNQSCKQNR